MNTTVHRRLRRQAPVPALLLQRGEKTMGPCFPDADCLTAWQNSSPSTASTLYVSNPCVHYQAGFGARPAMLASLFAGRHQLPILQEPLPSDHPDRAREVDLLGPEVTFDYTQCGATAKHEFRGTRLHCTLLLCEHYSISCAPASGCSLGQEAQAALHALPPIVINDEPCFDSHWRAVLVPLHTRLLSRIIHFVCQWHAGARIFDAGEYADEATALEQFIAREQRAFAQRCGAGGTLQPVGGMPDNRAQALRG
jgi:hypothetical protein